jgi:acetyl esterase/lipase
VPFIRRLLLTSLSIGCIACGDDATTPVGTNPTPTPSPSPTPTPTPTPPPTPPPAAVVLPEQSVPNLAYGSSPLQALDLSLPAGRTSATPLVVVVHGGGWVIGDKSELNFLADGLKARGFAVANINYRLAPGSADNFAMQLDDIGSAIDSVLSSASRHTFNNQKVYLVGHSSGAHIALGYAYTRNGARRVRAVGSIAGPTNLYALALNNPSPGDWRTLLAPIANTPLFPLTDATSTRYKNISPFELATTTAPPTIIFHGDLDWRVPLEQAQSLHARLTTLNVARKLIVYEPGVGHDWWTDAPRRENMIDELRTWFNASP